MSTIHLFDSMFIDFAKKYYGPIARAALFVIFFGFGFLKIVGLSPADELALGFAKKMGAGAIGYELYLLLAVIECIVGLLILAPHFTRIALGIMFAHMLLVSTPILFYPEATWSGLFVPSLEGQYIIKNAALVSLALGLVAATKPLRSKTLAPSVVRKV